MDQIQREKIAAKLKKIKALAERGVGGEKETAMRMYEDLKARYELEDEEIMLDAVTLHWFGYATELEEELLTQIFYKVTGGTTYHIYTGKYSRRKKRGCDCTEIEAAEITLLFNFYKAELKRELEAFMVAFRSGNNLYPDKTARCYKENNGPAPERTDEEKRMLKKAACLVGSEMCIRDREKTATGTDWRTGGGRRLSEDRKKIIAKLIKIKALAERGVGGEQATAQLMYDTLKKRYGITDEEVSRAAGGTVDITEIDLKQCWGLAFALGVIANNLQDEMELCTVCPHTHTEDCAGCGTSENIKDLQIQYETMKQKLEEVAMEV